MKNLIITVALVLATMAGQAQNISYIEETPTEAFIKHMEFCGYKAFTFDISSLRDSAQSFDIIIREYVNDSLVNKRTQSRHRLKLMISDLPGDEQQEILSKKSGEDMERGICKSVKTITIGFTPAKDSIERINIVTDMACYSGVPLKMKYLCEYKDRESIYQYRWVAYEEYKEINYKFNTFIPLVLYGSYWWDEKIQNYRYCGDVDSDGRLTHEKKSPHYYVIGIKFHNK